MSEAPFCNACRNMEKLGNQNGEAHLRVPPCAWVRMAPAPRKRRALETAAAATSGTTGDVAESEAEPAPAVTCPYRVCLVGLTHSSGSPRVLRQVKTFQQPGQADHGARAMPARLDSEVAHKYAALYWSGIHKSTHAPDFELQFSLEVSSREAGFSADR